LKAVVDSSVVLAKMFREPGGDALMAAIADGSVMSDINRAEVINRLMRDGADPLTALASAEGVDLEAIPFSTEFLPAMTVMFPHAKRANLSLADCACLATARHLRLPALTADKAWAEIAGDVGVEVVVVR
jgi:ribonuclease VapC